MKDFAQSGKKVIATARDPSSATQLKEVQAKHGDSVILIALDVSQPSAIPASGNTLRSRPPQFMNSMICIFLVVEVSKHVDRIDILINNAGIAKDPDNIKQEDEVQKLQEIFLVNTVGPLAVTQAFLPLLSKSANPRVINFSSVLGSIDMRVSQFPCPLLFLRSEADFPLHFHLSSRCRLKHSTLLHIEQARVL